MTDFKLGDRVRTPTGKTGVIIESDLDFPNHVLILLDTGAKLNVLKRILKPLEKV